MLPKKELHRRVWVGVQGGLAQAKLSDREAERSEGNSFKTLRVHVPNNSVPFEGMYRVQGLGLRVRLRVHVPIY